MLPTPTASLAVEATSTPQYESNSTRIAEPTASLVVEATARPESTATSEVSVAPGATDFMVIYQRSGGMAGLDETWTFYADGRIEASDGRSAQIAPTQMQQLFDDVVAADFFGMASSYLPKDPCCDRVQHTITVRQPERDYSVTVLDSTPNAPSALWALIERITQYIAASSPS